MSEEIPAPTVCDPSPLARLYFDTFMAVPIADAANADEIAVQAVRRAVIEECVRECEAYKWTCELMKEKADQQSIDLWEVQLNAIQNCIDVLRVLEGRAPGNTAEKESSNQSPK